MSGHPGSSRAGQHINMSGRGPRQFQSEGAPGSARPHQFRTQVSRGTSPHQSLTPRTPQGAGLLQSTAQRPAQNTRPMLPVFPVNSQPDLTARPSRQTSAFTGPSQPHRPTHSVPPLHFGQTLYDAQTTAGQPVLVSQMSSDQPNQQSDYFPPSGPPPHPSDPPLALHVGPQYFPVSERPSCQGTSQQFPIHPHLQPASCASSDPPPLSHPVGPPPFSRPVGPVPVLHPGQSVTTGPSVPGTPLQQFPITPRPLPSNRLPRGQPPLPTPAGLPASSTGPPLHQMGPLAPSISDTPPQQFQLSPNNARPQSFLSARSPRAGPQQSLPRGMPRGNSPHLSLPQGAPFVASGEQSISQVSPNTDRRKRRQTQVAQHCDTTKRLRTYASPKEASPHQHLTQRTPQGSNPMLPASSARGQSPVVAAETSWLQCVQDWYPDFDSHTYFVPPLHFNQVPYDVQTAAGQSVLVPQTASDQPQQAAVHFPPSGASPQTPASPLASQVFPDQLVPAGELRKVQDSDVRDDRVMQLARNFINRLAKKLRGKERAMLVLSQLDFRKYLDDQVDSITAAAVSLLPRPAALGPALRQGDFDLLMISLLYGLIVAEIKSVGADPSKIPDLDKAVVKTVRGAVEQLEKAGQVLSHLVSDLAPIRVIKTLVLPHITEAQLAHALASDRQVQQALCQCLGVPFTDAAAAVSRCLCKDDFNSPTSSVWWQRTVTDQGPEANMTRELYERLFARFCGPATTIEVPTVTTPRRAVRLRTLGEGVALTGVTMATLTLYPQQVDLVNRRGMPRVFLHGPPGTGKTVLLVLKALQWLHKGRAVHLLSTDRDSRAATRLIEHQLLHAPSTSATAQTSATAPASATAPSATAAPVGPRVHTHFYDFWNEGHVKAAVEELASVARDGELHVISDEAYNGSEFADFCTDLANRVPSLHLWAAAVMCDTIPGCLRREELAIPVRCPPSVVREVAMSVYVDGIDVPMYQDTQSPSATEGPEVMEVEHWEWSGLGVTLLPGHTEGGPENCAKCAERVVHLLLELRLGRAGVGGLQWRDVLVLCEFPGDNLPVVTCLRARGVPVQVLTGDDDEQAVRDVALAVRDAVTVTDYSVVSGLERRVVVVMGGNGYDVDDADRLYSVSRSTSLVVHVGGFPL